MWECGLKHGVVWLCGDGTAVTPHVGVWIETVKPLAEAALPLVTPHVGVWIEPCLRRVV